MRACWAASDWCWGCIVSKLLGKHVVGPTYLFRADGCPKTGACTELFLASIQAGMPDWGAVWPVVASVEGLKSILAAPPFLRPSSSSILDRA